MKVRYTVPAFALATQIMSLTAAHAGCPAGATQIQPGANIAAEAQAAPQGATFCIHAGVYRMQAIVPQKNQGFYGLKGAVLDGARAITTFEREGRYWVATHQTQQGQRVGGEYCLPSMPRCSYPEAFYIDDQPLRAVAQKTDVVRGTFFFDYPNAKIYFLDDPTGKTVEASVSPYAFRGGASGVVIEGLTIEKYSAPIQAGAVGSNILSNQWLVQNNEIRLNYGVGVIVGTDSRVVHNFIHDNGEMGIGCNGDDILIARNEIAGNGFFSGLDPSWEGGGGKCAQTDHLVVRNNYSHDNNSYGFWTDIDNINTLYVGNRIENNANGGISHEISYKAVIRDNTFKGNGYQNPGWLWNGAIQLQNSRDVEVYGNSVDAMRGNGITMIQQNRGSGQYGLHSTVNNSVHDNKVVALGAPDTGVSGTIADYDPTGMAAGNNHFDHNTYVVTSGAAEHWAWVNDFFDWADFLRKSGQGTHSRLVAR